jgi:rsbT co-antagonist protein RsbR
MKNQLADEGLREDLISNTELREQSEELIDSLVGNLSAGDINNLDSEEWNPVLEILGGIAITRARQGFSPRETGNFIFSLKEAVLEVLQGEIKDNPQQLFEESVRINRIMDNLSVITFETFIKGREEVILRQTDEIAEISTPVIRLWDGILGLPIIGTLDSARTQIVMENLLQEIVATGSSIAILDISGVPAVDSLVAQHLIKTVSATRLMGAECIISGIRPEIAQTVVHLGIDLSNIITKATLASALAYAFKVMRLEVKKVNTIQVDLYDRLALTLEADLVQMVQKTNARGVLIDISAVSIVDSFMGRILGNIASMSRILDAETVVVGMQPAVAITLIELGLPLKGVHTALDVEKGMILLRSMIDEERDEEQDLDADDLITE